YVGIGAVPGMPVQMLPTGTYMVLDPSAATEIDSSLFDGFVPENPGGDVNKSALIALIAEAEGIDESDYTETSIEVLMLALVAAKAVNNNPAASQIQVDIVSAALREALDNLTPVTPDEPVEIEPGKSYKMDIITTTSDNSGTISGLLEPCYYAKADVEMKTSTAATVTFYHAYSPEVMPDIVAYPEDVYGYQYDTEQAQNQTDAKANMVDAIRENLNADKSVKRITVEWPDINKPLFVTISYVPGMPGSLLPAPTFMVLKPATAVESSEPIFTGFEGDTEPPIVVPVNKELLKATIDLAKLVKGSDYTTASYNTMAIALSTAEAVYADKNATQAQVDAARTTLQNAYNALAPATGVKMEVGKTYLVDIYPAMSDGSGAPSDRLTGLYDQKAIVEVKTNGSVVTFFHSKSPMVDNPGGTPLPAPPSSVYGYRYDTSQSSTAAAAKLSMAKAPVEELNATKTVKRISVPWPNTNKPLFVTIGFVPGMPEQLLPAPTFMVLKPATAQIMTANTDLNQKFGFTKTVTVDVKKQTVNKSDLQALVDRASQVDQSKYTPASIQALNSALAVARKVLANASATQAQVNEAYVALKNAYDGLVLLTENPDGRYTVRVDFWHATMDQESMANNSLNKTAIVDINNGNMTMSISTTPIRVGSLVTALQTLTINGGTASVIASNITISGASYPSAFSFPLPDKSATYPASFTMRPVIEVMGAGAMPGRLLVNWATLTPADGAALSSNTGIVDVEKDLTNVERTAKKTDEKAKKPVMATASISDEENDAAGTGGIAETLGSLAENIAGKAAQIPWYGWTAITLGTLGACAVAINLYQARIALKGKGLHEIDEI
ncbi:MAG: NEAT domain-containing protein, partial [Coriobacteriia bacterium]|nr:NEAT domain-containing protein [Coriobacteriia bacterium]